MRLPTIINIKDAPKVTNDSPNPTMLKTPPTMPPAEPAFFDI